MKGSRQTTRLPDYQTTHEQLERNAHFPLCFSFSFAFSFSLSGTRVCGNRAAPPGSQLASSFRPPSPFVPSRPISSHTIQSHPIEPLHPDFAKHHPPRQAASYAQRQIARPAPALSCLRAGGWFSRNVTVHPHCREGTRKGETWGNVAACPVRVSSLMRVRCGCGTGAGAASLLSQWAGSAPHSAGASEMGVPHAGRAASPACHRACLSQSSH